MCNGWIDRQMDRQMNIKSEYQDYIKEIILQFSIKFTVEHCRIIVDSHCYCKTILIMNLDSINLHCYSFNGKYSHFVICSYSQNYKALLCPYIKCLGAYCKSLCPCVRLSTNFKPDCICYLKSIIFCICKPIIQGAFFIFSST